MKSSSVGALVDIFFVLFLLVLSPSKQILAGGALTSPTRSQREESTSSPNGGTFYQTHHHHHHHHSPSSMSWTSSAPSQVGHSSWRMYTSDGDGDDNGYSYNYGSKNMNRNKNYRWNSTLDLTSSPLNLMSFENDSMYLGGSPPPHSLDANGTEGQEMDDFEEGDTFEAELPWWRQMIWSILFGAMVVVACTGNITVIWIVLAHKRMRTVTNYLLVNLSIADAMSSTLNVIPNYSYMLTGHWPFGALYCKIVQFVSMLSICASVFSLMAIAFDRYMAIMNPLRPRMGKRLTLGIAAGIWIGGTILSMPMLIFFQTYEKIHTDGESQVICYSEWPDGPQTESYQEYLYNVFFMIFTYFIPIAVMGYTYTRVGIELWGSKSIGECTQRQLDNIKSKRRVVKMMIVVVTIFAFCWLPFHMYFIWVSLWPIITTYSFVQEVYLGIYWLAMSNSMYNPIIYCWMNNRFRRGFQQVFRWCPFVHYTEIETTTAYMMHTQRERETTRYSVTGSPELQLTRVSRNGSGSVHIHLHVLNNDSGRSPSSRSTNMNLSSMAVSGGGTQGYHHNNGSAGSKHHHQSTTIGGGSSSFHQHHTGHTQCHEFQRNLSSSSSSRGNTMV